MNEVMETSVKTPIKIVLAIDGKRIFLEICVIGVD